jgi:hypothetical protein
MSKPFFGKSHFAAIIARFVGTYQPSGGMDATKKAAENNTIFSSSEATSGTVSAQIATYPGRPARRVLSSLEYLQSSNRTIIQWRIIHATTPIEGRLKIGRLYCSDALGRRFHRGSSDTRRTYMEPVRKIGFTIASILAAISSAAILSGV